MAKLVAQQSVNTRDLPELALIKGGSRYLWSRRSL